MTVIATLVLGSDGSSTINSSSAGLSSLVDRERFLERRRGFDVLIIGGNTARNERYRTTPAPVVVLSHSRPDLLDINPLSQWWNCTPSEAIDKARTQFGESIGIEAGWAIVRELLESGAIDECEVSVSPVSGGENFVNLEFLLSHFHDISISDVDGTTFYSCRGNDRHS